MAFDKNRPYGEIFGDTDNGARYEQDGVLYGPQGNEVGRVAGYVAPKPTPKAAAPKSAVKVIGRPAPNREVEVENRKAAEAEEIDE